VADLDGDLRALDSLDVLGMTGATPVAMDESRAAAEAVELPYPIDDIRSVVVCGMGGSAIAADLVAGAYVERLRVPLVVVRDYVLPGWADEHTLVILSSYSGTTEETLTCAMQATERGTRCLAITSGGKLQERYVEEDGIPMVPMPLGLQPRAALPRSLVPLLVILSRIGALGDVVADLDEGRETAAASVAGLSASVPTSDNPAKQLARALVDSIPVFWGGQMTAPVAHRWRTQVNENAKRFAISSELPELDHNEICGFEGLGELDRRMQIVLLRDPRHTRQVVRRLDLSQELVTPHVAGVLAVTAEGTSPLARMLDLVLLGDYASVYLALLKDIDPGPVEMIERLKEKLAVTPHGRAQGGSTG
jgi:glucose/mannose-6-phosphate isomerase